MLPTLPGIQELVNVMRSEVSEYLYSDMSTPSGVRSLYGYSNANNACQTITTLPTPTAVQGMCNALHCETSDTIADSSLSTTRSSSLQPRIISENQTTETRPELITTGLHHQPTSSDSTFNPPESPQPVYTLLTSRTNKFPARLEVRATELSNPIRPSETQPPHVVYTVLTPRTNKLTPVTPKPDLKTTGLNDPSKLTTSPPTCSPAKVLKISPKPVYTVLTLNKFCHAKPNPNPASSMLYQLLKPSVPSTTVDSITSETESKSSNPSSTDPISNVSKKSCTRESHISPASPESTLTNSALNPDPKSTHSTNSADPEIKQRQPKPVYTVQGTETPETRVQNTRQTRSKSTTKTKKRPIKQRVPRASRKTKGCIPECKASCDGSLSDVKVSLEREALWKLFHEQGNEMMVSRSGRPMFPRLEFKVSGLDPQEMYKIAVNFVCVDNYRYNFYSSLGVWHQKIENRHKPESEHSRCFEDPQSPASGQFWNGKPLAFKDLRLTNRPTEAKNMVYVPTMRKHRIQLVVTMLRCARCLDNHTRHIDIPLTEFIAVSSYYNMKITEMKIANNPQAKMRCFDGKRKTRGSKRQYQSNCFWSNSDEVTSCQSDESHASSTSKSTRVSVSSDETISTTTSTQLPTDLNTSSILTTTSSVPMPPFVPQGILSSTSSSQLPSISCQATAILSTSSVKPMPCISSSTTTYPMEHCNIVYTCQTTKPTTHVQTDDDILNFIKIYLSPFQASGKSEDFDSSIFDELEDNLNYLSEKLDNFDNFNYKLQHLPQC